MNPTMTKLKEKMFLQQYLKNAEKQNQVTYAHFLRRKLNEEKLSIGDITKEDLMALYLVDGLIDKQIASLFGVTRVEIQEKRNEWAIFKTLAS